MTRNEFTPKERICPACGTGKLKKTNKQYAHWANMKRYTVPSVPQEICNKKNCNAKWLSPGVWSLVADFVAINEANTAMKEDAR